MKHIGGYSYLGLNAGSRPFSSRYFQVFYGLYFSILTVTLMMATNIRSGGYGGFSKSLVGLAFVVGLISAWLTGKYVESQRDTVIVAVVHALLFVGLIWVGVELPFQFGRQAPGPNRPLSYATGIYALTVAIVFSRLQRPVSPSPTDTGKYPEELFQVHFDNSWRIFQILLSLAVAVAVGVLLRWVFTLLISRTLFFNH